MKTILKWIVIVLGALIVLAFLAGLALYPVGVEKLNRLYPGIPVETVDVPTGSDGVIAGKHVADVWGCAQCHGANLGGMLLADDPFMGTIPSSNLTTGKGGIGKSYSDADWIRAIRHGVKPDGRAEILMYDYYSTLSDQDLGALIAYLKQVPPVDSAFPVMRFGAISPIAPAVGLFTPAAERINHSASRPADPAPGATVEYGRYLYSLCLECHGNRLAGKLQQWNQGDFVRAVRAGVSPTGEKLNPEMPSSTYREMNDTELAALWLYLQSRPGDAQ